MLVIRYATRFLPSLQVWWPEHADSVYPLLSAAPLLAVLGCSDAVAEALKAYVITHVAYENFLIDLSLSEGELWHRIRPRTRGYINEAKGMPCSVLVNEETQSALQLFNEAIRRKGYRHPISTAEWQRVIGHGDVFLVKFRDHVVAGQASLVDHNQKRARGLFGATVDRHDTRYRHVTGPLNRYLFWFIFNYYRARGFHWYDLGGYAGDRPPEEDSIGHFKQAFRPLTVKENSLRMAGNPAIRSMLRGFVAARRVARSVAIGAMQGASGGAERARQSPGAS